MFKAGSRFKAGDRVRVYFDDGVLEYVEGTLHEDRVVLNKGRGMYNREILEGLFLEMEKFCWNPSSNIMNRCVCHYGGRYYGTKGEKHNPYTDFDGVLKIAKKAEVIR